MTNSRRDVGGVRGNEEMMSAAKHGIKPESRMNYS